MQYRRATADDIDSLIALQNSCHIANVSRTEKSDGFLNTVLPAELLRTVINDERAVFVAEAVPVPVQQINEEQPLSGQTYAGQIQSGDAKSESVPEIVAMAVCASWGFWSFSESLNHIAEQLVHVPYNKGPLTQSNSYFWGPVCVSKACRGQGVFEGLFTFSLNAMQHHYPFVYTYVHTDNLRSYVAHTEKADFVFTQHIAINGQMFCEMVRETTT